MNHTVDCAKKLLSQGPRPCAAPYLFCVGETKGESVRVSKWVCVAETPKALRRMGRLAEPGPLGMRPEHLHFLLHDPTHAEHFQRLNGAPGIRPSS